MHWESPVVLKIHKQAGSSSYDCVRKIKRLLPKSVKKIGYFGTLDPFAEGLLLIALNQANRLTQFVHQDLSKTYRALGVFGQDTATQDNTSEIRQRDSTEYFSQVMSQFDLAFYQEQTRSFLGTYMQSPPAYSATKFEGKKLCDWIRNDGVEIKKEPVERTLYRLQMLEIKFPELSFEVECSSGTYIRTLFVDMAQKLGTLGCLNALVRTKIGSIETHEDLNIDNFTLDNLNYQVRLEELLPYERVMLSPSDQSHFMHGRSWVLETIPSTQPYWVCSEEGNILGLASHHQGHSKVLVGLH